MVTYHIRQAFTPLVERYAASEGAAAELTPVSRDATATEVVMLACGLLRVEVLTRSISRCVLRASRRSTVRQSQACSPERPSGAAVN
jgi:hypothetical protein